MLTFTEGFVTATLLFYIGSMAILGAIEDGVRGNPGLLVTKGVMDGTATLFLAASLGVGVLFSALPVLLYQGALTLAAGGAQALITPAMLADLSGLGRESRSSGGKGFQGFGIGGYSVGEEHDVMFETLGQVTRALPENMPRYLMGVGNPTTLVRAAREGVDIFRKRRHAARRCRWNNVQMLRRVSWSRKKSSG